MLVFVGDRNFESFVKFLEEDPNEVKKDDVTTTATVPQTPETEKADTKQTHVEL